MRFFPFSRFRKAARSGWMGYALALAAVLLLSVVIAFLSDRSHVANISMLYLAAVLASAYSFGSGPAIFASVAAFLAFNFFFVRPFHTFTVDDPAEWVTLLVFLAISVGTGRLAASQRRRTEEARQRERDVVLLYDVARLLSDPNFGSALDRVAAQLREKLQLSGVAIEIAAAAGRESLRAAAGTLTDVDPSTVPPLSWSLREGVVPAPRRSTDPLHWIGTVRPILLGRLGRKSRDRLFTVSIRSDGEQIGTLALARDASAESFTDAEARLMSAVGTQIGLASKRSRLRAEATEAEVLRRTDDLRKALLDAVSHDLRTPLASIIASAGLLRQLEPYQAQPEGREFAETIEAEARRLDRIVGNLLAISRIEAGGLRPDRDWYDLGALIEDVVARPRPAMEPHEIRLTIPDDLPPAFVDYVEIGQVLANLIENAAVHAPASTEIEIGVSRGNDELEVRVEDRGPGIPSGALADLFKPFIRVQVEGPRARETGLGLAIAKGFIEAHGGKIRAENRSGGGARFVFTLPLTGDPAIEPADAGVKR